MPDQLLVDFHAHLHDAVSIDVFLNSALRNFRRSIKVLSDQQRINAILCLADCHGASGFLRLHQAVDQPANICWRGGSTSEAESLYFKSEQGDCLWVVAGFQIVTAERLELMAIGTNQAPQVGQGLLETIERTKLLGALPVLPWGAGKWWSARGKAVRDLVAVGRNDFAIGDNGGRPWCWMPNLFEQARASGLPVLPGSDPLPIGSDRNRNGSHGLMFPIPEALDSPAAWLTTMDHDKFRQGLPFGVPARISSFLFRQLTLRLGKN